MPEPLEATLRRLKAERDEADRRYNDALTALDRAVTRVPDLPPPPPAYDDTQLSPLNQAWEVAVPPTGAGVKGRLAAIMWRVVGPAFQKQTAFNSRLVDHLNRNAAAHRETATAIDATLRLVRDQLADLVGFESHLIQFAQQITAYVDTKDRDTGGQALVLNAALNGFLTDAAKRWESLSGTAARLEAALHAEERTRGAADEELRTTTRAAQQAAMTAKRELERLAATPKPTTPNSTTPNSQGRALNSDEGRAFAPSLDAYKYVGFEEEFRGSQAVIRERLTSYLPYFEGASDVLDVGCGRGEFLDLLAGAGVTARGLDLNHEMVEVCRARGLDVAEGDAVGYLDGLPDGSLGGLFAAQVVEHLQPGYLLRFLELAHHKLRPGAPIVLETLNPACWVAFFESFIRDITHVWPLHPETLRYLVLASGFATARIEFRSPVPAEDKLQPMAAAADSPVADLVEAFNANIDKLNARMFTYLDYAIVGRNA